LPEKIRTQINPAMDEISPALRQAIRDEVRRALAEARSEAATGGVDDAG
jgi:hypothetical protein